MRSALLGVEHVSDAQVLLGAEKAIISYQITPPLLANIRNAVSRAGYEALENEEHALPQTTAKHSRRFYELLSLVAMLVVFVSLAGEWLGLFDDLLGVIPSWLWVAIVLFGGWPVFQKVIRAALNGRVISHTLMTLGVAAAAAVGAWPSAVVVVLFMRVGDYVEAFTTDKARSAMKNLAELAPQSARLEKDNREFVVPIDEVRVDDLVVVRPGEMVPVDGLVVEGGASVNQASITGESLPVEAGINSRVFAASMVQVGMLKIRVSAAGADTTFGNILRMVEEAEGNRADVQRAADTFAGYYLPIVLSIAALTFLLRRDPLSAAAVLVVACSCSFALATPIAMLASIGAAAKQGLLIKGGKVLETLVKVDALFVDKTGTLTIGKPVITDVHAFGSMKEDDLVNLAAAAERYSEHPLAQAVREAADQRGLHPPHVQDFVSMAGIGVRATLDGRQLAVVNQAPVGSEKGRDIIADLRSQAKALLFVQINNQTVGVLAAADVLRVETSQALRDLSEMGLKQVMLLSGDHEAAVRHLAEKMGIAYRAGLLPEEKIQIIKDAQLAGHVVAMVGDGVNDAPALAQADVGIAMGLSGSDLANQSASISLLREDWSLIPRLFRTAHRTMRVVRSNILFTAAYNLIGLSLAALGLLPPSVAAAMQSLPDLGILANSARLVRTLK